MGMLLKRIFILMLMLLLSVPPLAAKDKETLLELDTETLFNLSLEELLDSEIDSAGKMREKVGEIPASVYIVTRQDIETFGYATVADVIRNVPGFYTINDYSGDTVGVRGLLNDNNMMVLINGVPQHSGDINSMMIPAEAIDRIEVVRGPMSVIYGSGALLGSINIVTSDIPYDGPLNMVSFSGGSLDTYKAFARTSCEEGDFKYVLNASTYATDGITADYREMISSGRYEKLENNPEVDTRIDDDFFQKSDGFDLHVVYKGFYSDLQYVQSERGVFKGFPSTDGSRVRSGILTTRAGLRHNVSDRIVIEEKMTYSHAEVDETYSYFIGPLLDELVSKKDNGKEDCLEMEVDTIWNPGLRFNMVAGGMYRTVFDTSYEQVTFDREEYEGAEFADIDVSDRNTRALFVQMNYKPTENLKLVAGGRLEQSMAFKIGSREYNSNGKKYFIPRVAAIWSPGDRHILKLMYGKAIKPLSSMGLTYSEFEHAIIKNLEPEVIETVELNYLLSCRRFGFSLNVFKNNIGNIFGFRFQEDSAGSLITVRDNSGRMTTYGSEMIIFLQPLAQMEIELSGTYQETTFLAEEEEDLCLSPHLLFSGKLNYRWKGISFGISGLYVGEMSPQRPPESFWSQAYLAYDVQLDADEWLLYEAGDYFVTDINLRYEHETSGFFTTLKVSNLFDEEVLYPSTAGAQFNYGVLDEGRGLLATFGWKF